MLVGVWQNKNRKKHSKVVWKPQACGMGRASAVQASSGNVAKFGLLNRETHKCGNIYKWVDYSRQKSHHPFAVVAHHLQTDRNPPRL